MFLNLPISVQRGCPLCLPDSNHHILAPVGNRFLPMIVYWLRHARCPHDPAVVLTGGNVIVLKDDTLSADEQGPPNHRSQNRKHNKDNSLIYSVFGSPIVFHGFEEERESGKERGDQEDIPKPACQGYAHLKPP
jgi:hypothetical protein